MGYNQKKKEKLSCGKFPGGPVIKPPCFHAGGMGSTPGLGTKISMPHMWQEKKKDYLVLRMKYQAKKRIFPVCTSSFWYGHDDSPGTLGL